MDNGKDAAEEEGGRDVVLDVVVLLCSSVCAFYNCRTQLSAFGK